MRNDEEGLCVFVIRKTIIKSSFKNHENFSTQIEMLRELDRYIISYVY